MRAIRIKDYRSLIPTQFESLFGDQDGDDYLACAMVCDEDKAIDLENRTVRFIASDDSIDHHGEIVDAGAFHELRSTYLRNPVLLAAHQHRIWTGQTSVIGLVTELATDKNPLVGVAKFIDSQGGEDHWRAYKSRAQRAFSVGFRVRDTEKRDGVEVITRAELLEISAVPVPANRNALVINAYIASRIATEATRTDDSGKVKELMAAYDERLAALEKSLDFSGVFGSVKDVGDDGAADDDADGEPRSGDGGVMEKEICELVDDAVRSWRD